jgi:hypothetical protein
VVDDVIHQHAADCRLASAAEDFSFSHRERPILVPFFVAGGSDGRPGLGYFLVEYFEDLLLRLCDQRFEVGGAGGCEVELFGGQGIDSESGELGQVAGQAAQQHGLFVRLPG